MARSQTLVRTGRQGDPNDSTYESMEPGPLSTLRHLPVHPYRRWILHPSHVSDPMPFVQPGTFMAKTVSCIKKAPDTGCSFFSKETVSIIRGVCRSCQTDLVILPGSPASHPAQISRRPPGKKAYTEREHELPSVYSEYTCEGGTKTASFPSFPDIAPGYGPKAFSTSGP